MNNSTIENSIGKVRSVRLAWLGLHIRYSGSRGDAKFTIIVYGAREHREVLVDLEKMGPNWLITKARLLESDGRILALEVTQ